MPLWHPDCQAVPSHDRGNQEQVRFCSISNTGVSQTASKDQVPSFTQIPTSTKDNRLDFWLFLLDTHLHVAVSAGQLLNSKAGKMRVLTSLYMLGIPNFIRFKAAHSQGARELEDWHLSSALPTTLLIFVYCKDWVIRDTFKTHSYFIVLI